LGTARAIIGAVVVAALKQASSWGGDSDGEGAGVRTGRTLASASGGYNRSYGALMP